MNNKIVIAAVLFCLPFISNGQNNINDFKQNATEIKGRHVTQEYELDQNQEKDFVTILSSNVFDYYGLNEQYNTPLKREIYKKTNEYKAKELELKKNKQEFLSKTFALNFEMTYYEQHNLEYSTDTHSFDFDIDIVLDKFYNKNNIQLGPIIFTKPNDILIKNRQYDAAGLDYVRQTTCLIISDMNKALSIENQREHLRVLFLFNFTGIKPFTNNVIGFQFADNFLLTKLDKVILYNATNGEVYHIYSASSVKPNSENHIPIKKK